MTNEKNPDLSDPSIIDEATQPLTKPNTAADVKSPYINKSDFLLHEYDSLKSEVVQRIVTRYQIISIALVALGAVFTIQNPYLDLLFPVIALALLIVYISNARTIRNIGDYIQDNIENVVSEDNKTPINKPESKKSNENSFGWQNKQATKARGNMRQVGFSAGRMTFPICSIVAIVAGIIILVANSDPNTPPDRVAFNIILPIISFIIFLLTLSVAFNANQLIGFIEDNPDLTKVNGSLYALTLLGEVIKGLGVMIGIIKETDNTAKDEDTNA